jgi:hypothetical protein
MLLMTFRFVVECERSQLRMPNLLCRRLLLGLKKWQRQIGMARAYKDASLCLRKLKTFVKKQFASKVILFKETWSSKMP